jgi:hypothetical protein
MRSNRTQKIFPIFESALLAQFDADLDQTCSITSGNTVARARCA